MLGMGAYCLACSADPADRAPFNNPLETQKSQVPVVNQMHDFILFFKGNITVGLYLAVQVSCTLLILVF